MLQLLFLLQIRIARVNCFLPYLLFNVNFWRKRQIDDVNINSFCPSNFYIICNFIFFFNTELLLKGETLYRRHLTQRAIERAEQEFKNKGILITSIRTIPR